MFFREEGGSLDSIQGARPDPPYALFQQVSRPADPNKFDSAEIIALMLWAGQIEIRGILAGLEAVNDLWIPKVGDSAGVPVAVNVRCGIQSRVGPEAEPEARMPSPNEAYALWKAVLTYRVTYASLAPGQSWAVTL